MSFRILISFFGLLTILVGCQPSTSSALLQTDTISFASVQEEVVQAESTVQKPPGDYDNIEFEKVELLSAAPGTKSVLFNSTGSRLYAMNLEGMSVYEFDQETRKITREFKFKPTPGKGWDYEKDKAINSFEEKPVEACFSNNDKILWISLHNAEGIVPIKLDSTNMIRRGLASQPEKKIRVLIPGNAKRDSFYVPLIKTGKTPKVISRTADSKYLLVSNWHSYNVTVFEINENQYPYARLISTIPVASIPRGIAVDDKNNRSYVAIMGGATIAVINNSVWMKETEIAVASNPRHIVMDTSGRLFVSYNRLGKIACVDGMTGKTLFTTVTNAQPRTIMLSKNQKFLFVTCYSSDFVDVFKINDSGFEKITSLPCKGHPVGVDIFENEEKLEAWVCSYSKGTISVFSFRKKP